VTQTGWRLAAKRALDRTLGAVGLVAAAPVLAATAVAIRATMGAPVLFTQPRTGQLTWTTWEGTRAQRRSHCRPHRFPCDCQRKMMQKQAQLRLRLRKRAT
jgi:hypothetical protein